MSKALELAKFGRETPPTGVVVGDSDAQTLSSKTFSDMPVFSSGTANGIGYLNGSKVLTAGNNLVFDGTNLGVGTANPAAKLHVSVAGDNETTIARFGTTSAGSVTSQLKVLSDPANSTVKFDATGSSSQIITFLTGGTERVRFDTNGQVGVGGSPASGWSGTKSITLGLSASFYGDGLTHNWPAGIATNAYRTDATTWKYAAPTASLLPTWRYEQGNAVGGWGWFYAATGAQDSTINYSQLMKLTNAGNLGIGTDPSYKLHVAGDTYVTGKFLQSNLTSYPEQYLSLSQGTSTWIKLFTITNPGNCRVKYRTGSQNSEEQGEFTVRGTYVSSEVQLTWSRQTYNANLTEIRVTSSNGAPFVVWALVRTTEFPPFFAWQVIEAVNTVTLHNTTGETPSSASASINSPTWNGTASTHDAVFNRYVGIGTYTPAEKLHVQGKIRLFDGGYPYLDIGVNTSNYFRFIHDNPNDRFTIGKNSTPAMGIDGSGYVHFYTTGVAGAGGVNLTSADPFIRLTATGGTADKMKWDIRAISSSGSEALEFRTINDANNVFSTKLSIANDGRVSIGTTTADEKLTVAGNIRLYGNQAVVFQQLSGVAVGAISFRNSSGVQKAAIGSYYNIADEGAIEFIGPTSSTTQMIIRSSGYVGIGTTNPQTILDIQNAGTATLRIKSTSTNGGAGLTLDTGSGAGYSNQIAFANNGTTKWALGGKDIGSASGDKFSLYNYTAAANFFTVDTTGNVGIATVSPAATLHVVGTGSILAGTNPALGVSNPSYSGLVIGFDGSPNLAQIVATNPSNSQMAFYTKPGSGSAPIQRMLISYDGIISTPNNTFSDDRGFLSRNGTWPHSNGGYTNYGSTYPYRSFSREANGNLTEYAFNMDIGTDGYGSSTQYWYLSIPTGATTWMATYDVEVWSAGWNWSQVTGYRRWTVHSQSNSWTVSLREDNAGASMVYLSCYATPVGSSSVKFGFAMTGGRGGFYVRITTVGTAFDGASSYQTNTNPF